MNMLFNCSLVPYILISEAETTPGYKRNSIRNIGDHYENL